MTESEEENGRKVIQVLLIFQVVGWFVLCLLIPSKPLIVLCVAAMIGAYWLITMYGKQPIKGPKFPKPGEINIR